MELPFVDAHTHFLPKKGDLLVCADLSAWEILPELSAKKVLFSTGIHPAKTEEENMEHLRRKIEKNPVLSLVAPNKNTEVLFFWTVPRLYFYISLYFCGETPIFFLKALEKKWLSR